MRPANKQIGPVAENTILGWVLSGSCEVGDGHVSTQHVSAHVLRVGVEPPPLYEEKRKASDRDLLLIEEVKNFWEIEGVDDVPEEKIWDDFSKSITYIDSRKQYQVELLWKTDPKILPDNFSLALRCLYSTFARLKKKEGYLLRYDKIIRDQLDEGIIELVDPERSTTEPGSCHYLSHHPVVKENRKSTKMRMVFNGSGATKGNPSLNECLESGPCLLPKLFDNLVRFRAYPIALCSDIKTAFLRVLLAEECRDYVRFLWFDDISKESPSQERHSYILGPSSRRGLDILTTHCDSRSVSQAMSWACDLSNQWWWRWWGGVMLIALS